MSADRAYPNRSRSTAAVKRDHLAQLQENDWGCDPADNRPESVMVIFLEETDKGHDAIRRIASDLDALVSTSSHRSVQQETMGRVAHSRRSARGREAAAQNAITTQPIRHRLSAREHCDAAAAHRLS